MNAKKPRVVIDTQLFLRAAINRKSLPARLIFDMNTYYQLLTSLEITSEIVDVLSRPELRAKFATLTDEILEQIQVILRAADQIEINEVPAVSRDPKDDIFLACAQVGSASHIISEDNDLLVLNPYEQIQIINALAFLQLLLQQSPHQQDDR